MQDEVDSGEDGASNKSSKSKKAPDANVDTITGKALDKIDTQFEIAASKAQAAMELKKQLYSNVASEDTEQARKKRRSNRLDSVSSGQNSTEDTAFQASSRKRQQRDSSEESEVHDSDYEDDYRLYCLFCLSTIGAKPLTTTTKEGYTHYCSEGCEEEVGRHLLLGPSDLCNGADRERTARARKKRKRSVARKIKGR
jgi:hypothetical protein